MANWYVSSVGWTAVTAWAISVTRSSTTNGGRGDYVRQTAPAVGNARVFRCTTGGVGGATEPAWVLTRNATTNDGAVVWKECTGQEADQVSGTWKAPFAYLYTSFQSGWGAAGDVHYVAHDHAEATDATRASFTPPGTATAPSIVKCVLSTGTVPPVASDARTTAAVNGNSGVTLTFNSAYASYTGIKFSAGSGASAATISFNVSSDALLTFNNCELNKLSTAVSTDAIATGAFGGSPVYQLRLNNTKLSFGNTGDRLSLYIGEFIWRDTASAIGGTVPTALFGATSSPSGYARLERLDLSALGSGKTIVPANVSPRNYYIVDCKAGSSVIVAATPTLPQAGKTYFLRSDSAATNNRNEIYAYEGTQVKETVICRTGGASDSTSDSISTTANAKWILPFEAFPLHVYNITTGANVTATVEGIYNGASLPLNDDLWFDLGYLGSAATPLGSLGTTGKADYLTAGSAYTASTAAWDSLVTARANSTTYAVGNVRKVASNPGRIFFVTAQTGASASSEPAGFASAVDGGSVTDSGVTWRAAMRFKMAVTLSSPQPQMAGLMAAYPKVAKASAAYYLDGKCTLS